MGVRTLLEMRVRMQARLGDRDLSVALINGSINDGYYDLTGSTDFEEMHKTSTISVATDDVDVLLPQDLQLLRGFFNDTDRKAIVEVSEEHFWTLDPEEEAGEPKYYCRLGNSLRFWPALDEARTLRINYNKYPDRLEEDSDVTELRPTWDRAVEMFATYHVLIELGEEARASDWLNKALVYSRSRIHDSDLNRGAHLGVRVVTTLDDLQRLGG